MATLNTVEELKAAAEVGNIDHLYAVIQKDASVLDNIDSKAFVDTPMHVAAYAGHVRFAIEVMRLKPSYACKLNQQGFSPIHLAMQRVQELINQQGGDLELHKRERMKVIRLVKTNKDLVRVKGREGITPLHFASQIGDVDLLADLLIACPESIEDVTIRGKTALHIAVTNNHYDALQVLLGWLKRTAQKRARELETKIPNWKDDEGNTVLHISVLNNNSQVLQLLLKTGIHLNKKNLNNLTALDMVGTTNLEMKNILSSAGAKPSSKVKVTPTNVQRLRSNVTFWNKAFIEFNRFGRGVIKEQRDTYLIVATLVATAIYQSSLSPPGGVYQDNNVSMNTTTSQTNIGKSAMSERDFMIFELTNMVSLLFSIMAILVMAAISGANDIVVFTTLLLFLTCYGYNMKIISPAPIDHTAYARRLFEFTCSFVIALPFVLVLYNIVGHRLRFSKMKTKLANNYDLLN